MTDGVPAHGSMASLPLVRSVPALAAERMAEADRVAVEEYGIGVDMLMENAAHAVASACRIVLGGLAGRRIVCLCGTGNNGGDAIGAARRLAGWGASVSCVLSAPVETLRDTARRQVAIALRAGVPVVYGSAIGPADLVVDGLLGYSAKGAPRGEVARLIDAANASGIPILAVDLPSGLDPDTGGMPGAAIRAAATVTLALPKPGLLAPGARGPVGDLLLADIGIPASVYDRFGIDARGLFAEGELVRVER